MQATLGADTPGFVRITFGLVMPPWEDVMGKPILRREDNLSFLHVDICHHLIYNIKEAIGSIEPAQDGKINKVNQASSS